MPNHVHGIVVILGDDDLTVGAQHAAPLRPVDRSDRLNVAPGSLPAVIRSYKFAVTKRVNARRGTPGARVWQRNDYERVLRDARELGLARQYVRDNPPRWHHDRYHPDRIAR